MAQHSHDPDRPIQVDEELALALELIEQDEREHAAFHLAAVACEDPAHDGLPAALDALLEGVTDPLALMPLEERPWLGAVVLHAMLQARTGDLTEAIMTLANAQRVKPTRAYLATLWRTEFEPDRLRSVDATRVGNSLTVRATEADRLAPEDRHAFLTALMLPLSALLKEHTDDESLTFAASITQRRRGEAQSALDIVEPLFRRAPTYRLAIAYAAACGELGDIDRAVQGYEAAARLDPEDNAARLDIGNTLLGASRFEEARKVFADVLARDADNAWARVSHAFLSWVADEAPDAPDVVEAFIEHPQAGARAAFFFERMTTYEHTLPERPESVLKVVRRAKENSPGQCTVSGLEAPSAAALARRLAPGIEISFGTSAGWDARRPRKRVSYELWRYESSRGKNGERIEIARALLPPPSADTSRAVAELAARRYDLRSWTEQAREVATRLGAKRAQEILATMLHPPELQGDHWPGDWIFRVQVAAALILSKLDTGWGFWSTRKKALLSLLHGPVDWTSSAAVVALTQLAIDEPELRTSIVAELNEILMLDMQPILFMSLCEPIVLNLLRVPGLDQELREGLVAFRNGSILTPL